MWMNVQDNAPPKESFKGFYFGKSASKLGVFLQQYIKDK
jgi:hypothetical protein